MKHLLFAIFSLLSVSPSHAVGADRNICELRHLPAAQHARCQAELEAYRRQEAPKLHQLAEDIREQRRICRTYELEQDPHAARICWGELPELTARFKFWKSQRIGILIVRHDLLRQD